MYVIKYRPPAILKAEMALGKMLKGSGGILPQPIFKKFDCLRQHFVRFEGSLIGKKAAEK